MCTLSLGEAYNGLYNDNDYYNMYCSWMHLHNTYMCMHLPYSCVCFIKINVLVCVCLSPCRLLQWEATSTTTCWRSHEWSTKQQERGTSTSSTSYCRVETLSYWPTFSSLLIHCLTSTLHRYNYYMHLCMYSMFIFVM